MGRSTTTTVLFSDIVGSTDLLSRLGERAWDDVRREHFTVLRTCLADHDGSEVKNTGDGIMAVFDSVVDGVNCAVAMQRRSLLVQADGQSVAIRIGLAMGEALLDQGDWFGAPVVEAARLCSVAGAGGSWTTSLVRQLAGSQSEATFVHVGERLLKGFDQPTDVYALEPRQELQGSVFSEPGRHEDIGEQLVAVMDFWGSLPSMQRVRTAASAQLAALPGDVICDIGCGPGTELVRVARVVGPGGVAIGVDPSAAMLEEARRRADGANVTVELHQRDGRDTGLAAGRCDGVRMERVIQHVGDIDGLVAEAVRITRPGGRIVLVDSDWGSLMVYPGNRVLVDRVSGVFASKILPEAWAGRRLHDALLRHHLTDVRSTIYPIQADGGVLRTLGVMYQRYVGSELMSRAQADEHLAELASAFETGGAVFAFSMFVASGRVPEAPLRADAS
jgi:class 3 adenylate cyclase/ubiquinone/menaquinone biosynthesis C-methylase UbiE